MTTASSMISHAFAVWWKDVDRWSVNSFRSSSWQWPPDVIKKLSVALERRNEPVDKATFELKPEHFLSLRFSGEIEPRDLHGKSEFKGNLFFARAGDIIYSKIDVRNGAIGIVPDKFSVVTVTSEFPVYQIRRDVALPEYIQLVFRTNHFRTIINGMVSGTSGRKRVQPDELENVEIPLPTLTQQKAIIDRWHKAQERIITKQAAVAKHKASIDNKSFADLGLKSPGQDDVPKAFALLWKDIDRWGVDFNFLHQSGADLSSGKYPVVELGSLLELVQYGTSAKANTNNDGVAVVRMNNIVDGQFNLSNLKYIRLPEAEVQRLLLKDGDILFNRTNSKELVGKCAVFHAQGEFIFASYLIRVRAISQKADADYLTYVINSPIGRQQINAISRQIIGQANVNSEELRALRIPLPPLATQQKIMERVADGRAEIDKLQEAAKSISSDINAEVEALVLGSKTLREI